MGSCLSGISHGVSPELHVEHRVLTNRAFLDQVVFYHRRSKTVLSFDQPHSRGHTLKAERRGNPQRKT
jgi:hypothetical protein